MVVNPVPRRPDMDMEGGSAMNIPKRVDVGPHQYEVVTDERAVLALRDEGKYGITRPDRLEIHVDPGGAHTQVADTLLHEILHCIWDQGGLRMEEPGLEERVVSSLATGILAVLRQNPEVAKFLLSD